QRAVAEVRRRVETQAAVVAAEIAHRSRRELGHAGLAAANGQRTAEGLISQLTGTSLRDARTLVKAGELQPTATARTGTPPADTGAPAAPAIPRWSAVIGDAVARATITVEAADVIRTRLGHAAKRLDGAFSHETDGATAEARAELETRLADAAQRLTTEAPHLTIEQLAARGAGIARPGRSRCGGDCRARGRVAGSAVPAGASATGRDDPHPRAAGSGIRRHRGADPRCRDLTPEG